MRLNTAHAAVAVNPARHPVPLVFEPVGGGRYEGEVPAEVGQFLLSISRDGEYVEVAGREPTSELIPGSFGMNGPDATVPDDMPVQLPPRRRRR